MAKNFEGPKEEQESYQVERDMMAKELRAIPDHEERSRHLKDLRETERYQHAQEERELYGLVDSFLELEVLQQTPANRGNNGLIIRLDLRHTPPDVKAGLAKLGYIDEKEARESSAVKMLKVYEAGKGHKEFLMQQDAYRAVENAREKTPEIALVPRPYKDHTITLTNQPTLDHLSREGARLSNHKAELLTMEWVDGADFAEIVYREVLNHCDAAVLGTRLGLQEHDDRKDFLSQFRSVDDLQWAVGRTLELEDPRKPLGPGGGVQEVDRGILLKNSKKIFDFLNRRGYVIHPTLARQLKTALDVVHRAGIYHNDVHERNIMIKGDPRSADAQLYLIDFGSAHRGMSSEQDSFRDDYSLAKILESSSLSREERQTRSAGIELSNLRREIDRIARSERTKLLRERYRNLITQENGVRLIAEDMASPALESDVSYSLSALVGLLAEGVIAYADAEEIVVETQSVLQEKNIVLNKRKRIKQVYKPLLRKTLQSFLGLLEEPENK